MDIMFKNIVVAGAGYVGLANALKIKKHLNCRSDLKLYDINENRVAQINEGICPLKEEELVKAFNEYTVRAESDPKFVQDADLVIIAVNTNLNLETGELDMSAVESVAHLAKDGSTVVIKSTSAPGFTKKLYDHLKVSKPNIKIYFCPEFLRENNSWHDVNYPSRFILGAAHHDNDVSIPDALLDIFGLGRRYQKAELMNSTEAELVKVASNAYLALRVDFFNEIAMYCQGVGLNYASVIRGISKDPRIGEYYNNPSLGYGGYCLPKDSQEFASLINRPLANAIPEANKFHMKSVAKDINDKFPKSEVEEKGLSIGIYKIAMKSGSDNARESSSMKIANMLKNTYGRSVVIFDEAFEAYEHDFEKFKSETRVIVANRIDPTLKDCKVYTIDCFGDN